MHEMTWLQSHLDGDLDQGVRMANQLLWNLSVRQLDDDIWCVYGGEVLIYKSVSWESIDAFIYGLGLAYAVLPVKIFDRLKEDVIDCAGE